MRDFFPCRYTGLTHVFTHGFPPTTNHPFASTRHPSSETHNIFVFLLILYNHRVISGSLSKPHYSWRTPITVIQPTTLNEVRRDVLARSQTNDSSVCELGISRIIIIE
jgi:hypothetical protein